MKKTFYIENLPEEQIQVAKTMQGRIIRMVNYCGYKKTAKDVGVSIGTLQKIITDKSLSYEVWQKVIKWNEKWII